jgi:hypothetical protein
MAEVKISYSDLTNKVAKPTNPTTVVKVKSILNNLRTYILNSVN